MLKSRYAEYFESKRVRPLGTCPIYYYIDTEFFDKLEELLRERLGRKYREIRNYYTLNEFAKIMNCDTRVIKKYIEDGAVIADKKPFSDYYEYIIPLSENDRLMNFKATHTSLKDIVDKMYNETLERGLIKPKAYKQYRNRVRQFIEKSDYFGCDFIHSEYTIFSKDFGFFVNKNDLKIFEENLESYEMNYEFNKMTLKEREKKSFDMINSNLKKTLSDLKSFYDYRVGNLRCPQPNSYLSIVRGLGNILDKELYQLNNDEILDLIMRISKEFPEKSKQEFLIQFIDYTKENNICTFTKEFAFNYKAKTHMDVSPYTEEQMFRMAVLVFNETHSTYKKKIEKSLENRKWLSIWLFTALHYVCAWRTVDLIVNLPRITLPTETYQELFKLVEDNKFTKEMADRACDELTQTIHYLDIKPHKTRDKATHPLVMDIPEGAKETIGLLLCLSEAHLQKIECETGKALNEKYITNYVRNDWAYEYVFGPEFIDIFEKDLFSNRRANKYYLDSIAKKVDEDELGIGYIIASLARAHNFTLDKLSNTTDVYLNYYKDIPTMDILTMTLFERGVCSFIPYLALKMIEGEDEVRALPLETQSEKINKLPSPINIELLIGKQSKVLQTAKEDISELISFYMNNNSKKIKEDVYKFISKIAKGTAPCKKYNNIYCMSVAKGLGCTELDRDCIGCGQEIYLKSAMHILGNISISLAQNHKVAKTNASKKKYELIIKNVIKPIISNFITCLEEIYSISDVSEFKKIYSNNY